MQYKACTIIAPNMKCAINRFHITRFPPDIPELFIDTLTAIKFPDISRFSRPLATRRICSKRNWWIWIVTGHTHRKTIPATHAMHRPCCGCQSRGRWWRWRGELTCLDIQHRQLHTTRQQADSSPPCCSSHNPDHQAYITLTIKHTQWPPSTGLQQADSSPPCCSSHNPDHQAYTMTTIDRLAISCTRLHD